MQFVINNWYLFAGLVVVLALLVAPNVIQLVQGIKNLTPSELVTLVNRQSAVVVDVSEVGEFKTGHIPNAINLPLSQIDQGTGQLAKFKERPVIVTCRTPNKSIKAASALRKRGFGAVHVLGGGLAAWDKQGLPLEK